MPANKSNKKTKIPARNVTFRFGGIRRISAEKVAPAKVYAVGGYTSCSECSALMSGTECMCC